MSGAKRRSLFRIHAWVGLNLGFLLYVICLSGTIAVFSWEINWAVDPSARVDPLAADERPTISWQTMYDNVAAGHPHAMVAYLFPSRGESWAARAAVAYSPRDFRWVLVDPYTGDLRGLRSGFNLVSFFRIFHKQLYVVPGIFGIHGTLIVGALAILLLVSSVTGVLSIKRWWRAFVTLRTGRSRRLLWSDVHRLTGVWPLIVTVVLGITGVWYLAENILIDTGVMDEEARPARLSADTLKDRPPSQVPLDLDRAAGLAKAAYPELSIAMIALPLRPGDPLIFTGQADALLVRDRANAVQMDPYTGEILGIRRAEDLGAFDRWVETADPLHFGTFGGLTTQILWFVGGLMLSAGILTGLYSAWMRLGQTAEAGRRGRLHAVAVTLPSIVLLIVSIAGAALYGGGAMRLSQQENSITPLADTRLGPWAVQIARLEPASSPPDVETVIVSFPEGHPNFLSVAIWAGDPQSPPDRPRVRRLADRIVGRIEKPGADCSAPCTLNVAIEDWSGQRHSVSLGPDAAARNIAPIKLPVASGLRVGEIVVMATFLFCIVAPLYGWIRLQFRR